MTRLILATATIAILSIGCGGIQTPPPNAGAQAAADGASSSRAKHDKAFAELAAPLSEACRIKPVARIDWQTIDDAALHQHDVSARCGVLLEAMIKLCKAKAAPPSVSKITEINCSFGDENHLALDEGTLDAVVIAHAADLPAQLEVRLKDLKEGTGPSLAAAKVDVCYKGADKKQVIILAPSDAEHPGLSYGDGKSFYYLGQPRMLGLGWFFAPRHPNNKNNENFRGYDLRVYSKVDVDRSDKRCTLRCGTREVPLKLASLEQGAQILEGAEFEPPPHQREPYALARDTRGTYYFVDRGKTEDTRKDFRVYIGKLANLKPQPMRDIVSDSGGEIFATKKGKLRLIVGRSAASWISGKKKNKLKVLPIRENLVMIYNELGVYLGKRLGTPCDDL